MINTIIEFLNFKVDNIESVNCSSLQHELVIELSLKRRNLECPKCGTLTCKVLNQYSRKINHGIFIDRKCIVHYKQKRYQCPMCNHTFNEDCSLVSKHQKKSLASHLQLMELLKDPHLTFKKTAELLNLSTNTVIDSFYANLPNHKLGYSVYLMKYRELLFNIDPLIKEIYELKEKYIAFNRLKEKGDIIEQIDTMISKFNSHPNKDVSRVGRTIHKWRQEILNSFNWFHGRRISNGPIESRNNIIKLLIRNAAGYRNFDHLRRRIIYCINQVKRK